MALFLVGTGLSEGDITDKAIALCMECSAIFLDSYTSVVHSTTIEAIRKATGKEIKTLSRSDMEENAKRLISEAKTDNIAVLTGGDPLIATTHKILFLEAKKQGVKFAAIHSTSIFSTAIGESGLDFYKFGKTFTIPSWSEHYRPISFYETLKKNQSICAHSVALLDFDQSKGVSMPISDALAELEAAEAHYKDGIISPGKKIFIMANLCGSGEIKDYITFADAKQKQYGSAPALIIIPAQLSDIEEEIVRSMYGN